MKERTRKRKEKLQRNAGRTRKRKDKVTEERGENKKTKGQSYKGTRERTNERYHIEKPYFLT